VLLTNQPRLCSLQCVQRRSSVALCLRRWHARQRPSARRRMVPGTLPGEVGAAAEVDDGEDAHSAKGVYGVVVVAAGAAEGANACENEEVESVPEEEEEAEEEEGAEEAEEEEEECTSLVASEVNDDGETGNEPGVSSGGRSMPSSVAPQSMQRFAECASPLKLRAGEEVGSLAFACARAGASEGVISVGVAGGVSSMG
jgi:hypothetical protein